MERLHLNIMINPVQINEFYKHSLDFQIFQTCKFFQLFNIVATGAMARDGFGVKST
jgi:hypothetical protein